MGLNSGSLGLSKEDEAAPYQRTKGTVIETRTKSRCEDSKGALRPAGMRGKVGFRVRHSGERKRKQL